MLRSRVRVAVKRCGVGLMLGLGVLRCRVRVRRLVV